MAKLTEKQKRFVEEYLIDLNATQAAIRAGYSPQRASEIGYQLLQKTTVSEAIAKAKAERSKRTGINQDRVLEEFAKVAFSNAEDLIDLNSGNIKSEVSREDIACIKSVKVKKSTTDFGETIEKEIKFYDKLSALEKLGKHLGLFDGNNQKETKSNNLFEAINECSKGEFNDIQEVQQSAETDIGMVE